MRHGQLEDRLEVKLARRGLDGVLVDPSMLVGHVSDVGSGEGKRADVLVSSAARLSLSLSLSLSLPLSLSRSLSLYLLDIYLFYLLNPDSDTG